MKLKAEDFIFLGVKREHIISHINFLNKFLDEFKLGEAVNRWIYFLANVLHESGNFRYTREIADGSAYEGRRDLGNTQPGDGKRFRGRGWIQVTGRSNYAQFTIWYKKRYPSSNLNFVANPELLETPEFTVLSAFWYWDTRGLNLLSDAGNFRGVCGVINAGNKNATNINGMEDRMAKKIRLEKWLTSQINS